MKKKSILNRYALFSLSLANLGLLLYQVSLHRSQETAKDFSDSKDATELISRKSLLRNSHNGHQAFFLSDFTPKLEDIKVTDPSELARKAMKMNDDDLVELSTPIDDWIKENEEEAIQWLDQFSEEMVTGDTHDRLAFFLGYLNSSGQVRDIERKVFHHWSQDGYQKVMDHLTRRLKNEDLLDSHHAAILASLFLNEYSDQASDFISMVSSIDESDSSEMSKEMQATFIDKLFQISEQEEHLSQVVQAIESNAHNPRVAANLVPLARILSVDRPEETLTWLSQIAMDDDEVRVAAFATVFEEVSAHDKEVAANILSGENFLKNYYHKNPLNKDGSLTDEAKNFFDATLESFVNVMLVDNPQIAAESTSAFFSEEKQKIYQESALAAVQSIAENGPHEHGIDCKNCESCKTHN